MIRVSIPINNDILLPFTAHVICAPIVLVSVMALQYAEMLFGHASLITRDQLQISDETSTTNKPFFVAEQCFLINRLSYFFFFCSMPM